MAMKGKMELTIGIAVGSSIQISTFVIPLLVIVGWITHKDLTLYFANFETIALFVAVLLVLSLALASVQGYITEREYQREFTKFVKSFNRRYTTDEFFSRFEIFKQNLDLIELHNSQTDITSTIGVNQYADMTSQEMANKLNGYRPINRVKNVRPLKLSPSAPTSLDWNAKGAVTAIKDQGQCGSCWSFSATGSIEGAVFLKSGNLTSLSEQQLMDCSTKYGNQGCNGGLMDDAFKYAIACGGLEAEASYPYETAQGKCRFNASLVACKISAYTDIPQGSESALIAAKFPARWKKEEEEEAGR